MLSTESEIFKHAVKLLAGRDYTVAKLREKLEAKHGEVPESVIQQLIAKKFLNDRRFAENFVSNRKNRGTARLREELLARGITEELVKEILSGTDWPSLRDALAAKMVGWKLRVPLQPRDAARLFRALARLGYEEDAIREEIDQLHGER
jgi:SOS response regulatory protein OraA/RecX